MAGSKSAAGDTQDGSGVSFIYDNTEATELCIENSEPTRKNYHRPKTEQFKHQTRIITEGDWNISHELNPQFHNDI